MTIRTLNEPSFLWTCDLCGREEESRHDPKGWITMSVYVTGIPSTQRQICGPCLTTKTVEELLRSMVPAEMLSRRKGT